MKKEYFEVILADDELSRRIHYQLRYQVFCLDTGYEDPVHFPDGEEKDEWDVNAVHFLVRERETQRWVAAMRLVFPLDQLLPIEKRARIAPESRLRAGEAIEISRLCMVGHYRRRLQAQAMPCDHGNVTSLFPAGQSSVRMESSKRLRTVEILRTLLDAAVAYSRDCGTRHWYLLTTRALAKVATYVLPLQFQQVGEPVWHRGERYPFLVSIEHLMEKVIHVGMTNPGAARVPAFRRHSELLAASNMARAVGAV